MVCTATTLGLATILVLFLLLDSFNLRVLLGRAPSHASPVLLVPFTGYLLVFGVGAYGHFVLLDHACVMLPWALGASALFASIHVGMIVVDRMGNRRHDAGNDR